jgi:hypothetical protein
MALFAMSLRSEWRGRLDPLNALTQKQFPFAASQALNRLVRQAVADLKIAMQKDFDRPKSYTLNAFYARTTTKRSWMQASVEARDNAGKGTPGWKYLTPEVFGGTRRMKRFERALQAKTGGGFTVPGRGAVLDQYGNIPESEINRILSALGAFQEGGYLANRTARSAKRKGRRRRDYFIAHAKDGGRVLAIYRVVSSGHVEPVLVFTSRAPSYRKRFPYLETVKASVLRNEATFFREAMAHAVATAH